MIKIIFSDMDGTLLDGNGQLPVGFDEMMTELKARGVIFAPTSGRQYFSLLKSFPKYENDFLFIAENGTLVMHLGREIFSRPMTRADADTVLDFGAQMENIFRVFCGKKGSYYIGSQVTPAAQAEFAKYFTKNTAVESFDEIDDEPLKISMLDSTRRAADTVYPKLRAEFGGHLKVDLSSDQWVDVMNSDVSKGVAIENVQRLLNIAPDECAAFGDYLNDVEMMNAVGYGFAMSNAHPELKTLARFETLDNNHAGVMVGIRRLIDEGLI